MTPTEETVIKPAPLPVIDVDPKEEIVLQIISTIGGAEKEVVGTGIEPVTVVNQPNDMGNTFTVTVKNDKGTEFVAVCEKPKEGPIKVVDVRPIVDITVVVEEKPQE